MTPMPRLSAAAIALLSVYPVAASATNGMNLEGWGAKAAGMGGAGYGYDSGNSAIMNNPATLGLKTEGKADLGLGLTLLAPDVTSSHPMAGSTDSDGTAYWMPTLSYIRRSGDFAYGIGMLAQGGMGTEYGVGSNLFAGGMSSMGTPVAMSGEEIRSEVGFGRLMLPLVWNANTQLSLAAQLDLAWASMDLQMDMDGQSLAGMLGAGFVSGGLTAMLPPTLDYARFDFSDDNAMTGQAKSYGWGYKLGAHYKINQRFGIGASYHAKTHMGDMKTDDATMTVVSGGMPMALNGTLKVVDFQWPETYGIGVSWMPSEKWLWVADIKRILWSDAMQDFRMQFSAGPGMDIDVTMPQNWKDQTVIAAGVQYKWSPSIALRFGLNHASNPVPDATLNPLFPATTEWHYTAGIGWRVNSADSVAAALTYVPEASDTNPVTGITSDHGQYVLRVNYNHTF
ncbi:MAG: outer membrane protein transport protein [Hydrogenophilales bacterium]|nr:outer membrane protein transport protein [Hydrogenophilales bacterium]